MLAANMLAWLLLTVIRISLYFLNSYFLFVFLLSISEAEKIQIKSKILFLTC